MRALILAVAVMLSAGSGRGARGAYAARSLGCGSMIDPQAKAQCFANANTSYAVESQRELVEEQNDAQFRAQLEAEAAAQVRRCDAVAGRYLACQMIVPGDAVPMRNACLWSISASATVEAYGRTLCAEQAADCDGLRWCLSH